MNFSDLKNVAVLAALLGVGLLIASSISGNIPNPSHLTKLEGHIDWVKATGKYGHTIRFKFQEDDTHLVYHSIGGQISKVQRALAQRGALISVLYDQTDSHSPPFDQNEYHTIYELVQNGVTVRSHSALAERYAENSRLLGWMGLGVLICLGFLILAGCRKKKEP
ncbi:hypothetical protein LRP49_17045 [Enterovibrio sp. ZSDZ35]|uniref:Uncharacterized protein n=1 Tax=Enterovibrio qingdaonensis TaxID=2899818 RepID=A0ABT5QQA7_9GAMM|nr:hypothetical protein [Enterovibrio sp. ZSDZ35]MDD1782883.1 hypothetical protein [Enterovibrio sp. ZSDZ35]